MKTQPADEAPRRAAIWILLAATAAGAVLVYLAIRFRPQFVDWLQQDLDRRLTLVVAAMTLFSSGPVLALAVYLWSLGTRAIRAKRYPPPGVKLRANAASVYGADALRLGRAIRLVGAAIGAIAVLLAIFLWRLVILARSVPHA